MIRNTEADCKIQGIKISGSRAYVTLLIFSMLPAETPRCFKFYLLDTFKELKSIDTSTLDKEMESISNSCYWIDRNNNYDNSMSNVDINMYKEIILEIDITKLNTGEIRDNRWVRECQLVLRELIAGEPKNEIAWLSTSLTLISERIQLPDINNLAIFSDADWLLYVDYSYTYKSQEDFNYTSRNFYTEISTVSHASGKVLETIRFSEAEIRNNHVRVHFNNPYDDYIRVRINLYNNKNVCLYSLEKLCRPQKILQETYIKHKGVAYRVLYVYYKGDNIIEGGPLLDE